MDLDFVRPFAGEGESDRGVAVRPGDACVHGDRKDVPSPSS